MKWQGTSDRDKLRDSILMTRIWFSDRTLVIGTMWSQRKYDITKVHYEITCYLWYITYWKCVGHSHLKRDYNSKNWYFPMLFISLIQNENLCSCLLLTSLFHFTGICIKQMDQYGNKFISCVKCYILGMDVISD